MDVKKTVMDSWDMNAIIHGFAHVYACFAFLIHVITF